MTKFEGRLDQALCEAFGVKELKEIKKTRLKRSSVGTPSESDIENRVNIPNVSHFANGPSQQSAFGKG